MFVLHCEHGTCLLFFIVIMTTVFLLLPYKYHVCNVCTLLNLNLNMTH